MLVYVRHCARRWREKRLPLHDDRRKDDTTRLIRTPRSVRMARLFEGSIKLIRKKMNRSQRTIEIASLIAAFESETEKTNTV